MEVQFGMCIKERSIFLSTACLSFNSDEAIMKLHDETGIQNFELSAGQFYDAHLLKKLKKLQQSRALNLIPHNYFPIPKSPFLLNLGSINEEILHYSREHALQLCSIAEELGSDRVAFHGPYLIDFATTEIGGDITNQRMNNDRQVRENFYESLHIISTKYTHPNIFIENNVLSFKNYSSFKKNNPFLFTTFDDFERLNLEFDNKIKPLLDIAHLKVSCRSLNLNFEQQIKRFGVTDYIHVSGNDGYSDSNDVISGSDLTYVNFSSDDLVVTLEVYGSITEIKQSIEVIRRV